MNLKKIGPSIHPGRILLAMSPPGNITLMDKIILNDPQLAIRQSGP